MHYLEACFYFKLLFVLLPQVNDDGQIEGTQEPLSNGRKMRSLQDFFDLYQKVKSSFGWCGPTFVKTQRGVHMLGNIC